MTKKLKIMRNFAHENKEPDGDEQAQLCDDS